MDYDLDLTNALWNLAWHANPSEMDAGGEHCDHEQWYDEALTTLEGLLQDESRSPEDRIRLALRFVKRTSALTYCDIVYPTVIADAFHGAYVALGDPPNVMSQLLESERSNGAHRR